MSKRKHNGHFMYICHKSNGRTNPFDTATAAFYFYNSFANRVIGFTDDYNCAHKMLESNKSYDWCRVWDSDGFLQDEAYRKGTEGLRLGDSGGGIGSHPHLSSVRNVYLALKLGGLSLDVGEWYEFKARAGVRMKADKVQILGKLSLSDIASRTLDPCGNYYWVRIGDADSIYMAYEFELCEGMEDVDEQFVGS